MFDSDDRRERTAAHRPHPVHGRIRRARNDPDSPAPDHGHPEPRGRAVPRRIERDGRRVRCPRIAVKTAYAQVNLGAVLFAVSDDVDRGESGSPDAEGARAGVDLDPAVQDHRPDPPHAGARPPRGPGGADGHVHPGDRRDLLVGHGRRGAAAGTDDRVQPQPGPDPRPAPGRRSVERARSIR